MILNLSNNPFISVNFALYIWNHVNAYKIDLIIYGSFIEL